MFKHMNAARAGVVGALTTAMVVLVGPSAFAQETTPQEDIVSEITGLGADLGTYAVALVGLIAVAVAIGFGIRFLLKAKRAASGV